MRSFTGLGSDFVAVFGGTFLEKRAVTAPMVLAARITMAMSLDGPGGHCYC